MWNASGRLPHVLPPEAYFAPEQHEREQALFARAWHCVATRDALRAPGDFVTCELLGEPLLVRNCDGDVRAFQNVCAHRHSLLTSLRRGSSPRMKCQYHGWEYDADGKSLRIPDAKSFVPLARGSECLVRYRAETLGQLVFVSLSADTPSLRDTLGERTCEMLDTAQYVEVAAWTIEHRANWKVVVENALESYHVPIVHTKTFKKLSSGQTCTHTIGPSFTTLENAAPPTGRLLQTLSELWRRPPRFVYVHHHAFPNLLVARTDISTLVQTVVPISPTRSRSFAVCFVHESDGARMVPRVLAPAVQLLVARFSRQVLDEDNALFPNIQRGLEASRHRGVIGAREERVHAFQQYIDSATRKASQSVGSCID